MVDLGDTSSTFAPFMKPGEDKLHIPLATGKDSKDVRVLDLRSLRFKKGELFSIVRAFRRL